jgi:hypothetical protein
MGEILTPILINIKVLQDVHIIIKTMITNVYVNEQLMMVQNDYVVYFILFFSPIKPCAMCLILLKLLKLNQSVINKPNTS